MWGYDDERDTKRTLGIRDKQILYRKANKRCENPTCGKKLEFDEMQVGHKTSWSRGGSTTLKNSVCICYRCNKLQGTDSWATFLKKQGVEEPKTKLKKSLETLNIKQLKYLAKKHNIVLRGQIVETFFESHRTAPSKRQYINKLSGIVTEKEVSSAPKETPKPAKRKRRRNSDNSWL
jgi:hypothetical protein